MTENFQDRMELVEKIDNKKELLDKLTQYYYQRIINDLSLVKDLKKIIQAQKWIKQNVMPKAVIDFLMISLKKH